jgi:hypothetical protein
MVGLARVSACLTEIGIRKSGPFGLLELAGPVRCSLFGALWCRERKVYILMDSLPTLLPRVAAGPIHPNCMYLLTYR